jgi:hypothetical protein
MWIGLLGSFDETKVYGTCVRKGTRNDQSRILLNQSSHTKQTHSFLQHQKDT